MGVSRTRTIKNKHAANKSGISGSKASRPGPSDGVVKAKRNAAKGKGGAGAAGKGKGKAGNASVAALLKRRKKVYTEKELDIPKLNMVTPVGVEKPKGRKKGKVFVDDRESMNTILAMVQADKQGEIESKMIKARQMEEIREARRAEAEAKESQRKTQLDQTKDALRKKRKRNNAGAANGGADGDAERRQARDVAEAGSKPKGKKKKVSFA